jgi:hypothetical protein
MPCQDAEHPSFLEIPVVQGFGKPEAVNPNAGAGRRE